MRLFYDKETIGRARRTADAYGHELVGRFTRVRSGLSWQHRCSKCNAYVLVMPRWGPHPGIYGGPLTESVCKGGK